MQKTIRWGFIGCGKVVSLKSGPAFHNPPCSRIEAIMRRDMEKARISAQSLNARKYYDNIHDLVNDKEVNAVYIATPPGLHFEQAIACCNAGKPVYMEKPFTRNYSEAKQLVEAFEKNQIPLFAAHYRRALPRFHKIKELLDTGHIGTIYEVDFRLSRKYSPTQPANTWLYDPVMSGGGKFFDIAPHSIDLLVYLFGKFTDVKGMAVNRTPDHEVEDIVTFSFKTEKEIVGSANFNTLADKKADRIHVYGSSGHLEFSIHGSPSIIIHKNGTSRELVIHDPQYIQQPMIEAVTNTLLGIPGNTCSGRQALETYQIIDIILDDFYHGRTNYFL